MELKPTFGIAHILGIWCQQLQLRDFEKHQLDNDDDLGVAHQQSGSSCTIPGKTWKLEMLVLEERGKPE